MNKFTKNDTIHFIVDNPYIKYIYMPLILCMYANIFDQKVWKERKRNNTRKNKQMNGHSQSH